MSSTGRKPGTPKTGGRKKGTPNKTTAELRSWLTRLLKQQKRTIINDLAALEPKDRLQMLEKLMQYVIPKQQSITADISLLTDEELSELAARLLATMEEDNENQT